jgi:hypothetical protein
MSQDKRSIKISTPIAFFAISSVIFVLQIIVVSTHHWVRLTANGVEESVGLFYSDNSNIREISCNTDTSTTQCGYLKCAQVSAVISLFFSAAVTRGYYSFSLRFEAIPIPGFKWFVVSVLGILNSVFCLMCVVIFHFYKTSYLTQNDDLNIEYPSSESIQSSDFQWSYWLMAVIVIATTALSVFSMALCSSWILNCLNMKAHVAYKKADDGSYSGDDI